MDDDSIDLTPLDPDADPNAEDRFVSAVMAQIGHGPRRYPVPADALWGAWSLARPVLIAASIVIAIAGVVIARARHPAASGPLTVTESLGVPSVFLGSVDR
jgi:hypothetical protein